MPSTSFISAKPVWPLKILSGSRAINKGQPAAAIPRPIITNHLPKCGKEGQNCRLDGLIRQVISRIKPVGHKFQQNQRSLKNARKTRGRHARVNRKK
jgi:hypothetical protein